MRRDVVALVATVVGFHAFCVLVDSNLFYNALAWIDPYTHVGLGLYYTDPNFWDNYYKISRVPWNALHFVVRHVFTPAASGVVIQSLCAVGTTLAVYRIGRTLFARDVALTVAMLATFFPFFHANGGADYNNALAAPLFFTTWALAQAWAERPRRAIALACGVAAASTLHTSPLFIMTGPCLAITALAVGHARGRTRADLARFIGLALLGFILTHVAFAAWQAALGRNWAFYMPQYRYIQSMREDPSRNIWWAPFAWSWLKDSTPNAFMLAVAIVSLAECLRLARARASAPRASVHLAVHGSWLFVYVAAVVYQVRGQTTLYPDYLGHLFNACTLLPLGCVVDAAVTRSQAGMSRRRWWPLVFPALTVAALYAAATFGRPAGLDAFPWTIAATLIFYGATFTTVARGMRAMLYLPLVNATLLVYPDFYKVNTCHALRHLNTVMIEASRLGSRFVDHPDDLFVWTDGGNPREVLTTPCYAGIATTDFTTSFRSIAHRRLGEFTDENPFAHEEDDEGHVALVTATDDGYARFVERMKPHGVQLEIMASYQDPPSGLHIYILLFTQDRQHTP